MWWGLLCTLDNLALIACNSTCTLATCEPYSSQQQP